MLKDKDIHQMYIWGRHAAIEYSPYTLEKAAEYLVIATPEEEKRLRSELFEGLRNYAHHQGQLDSAIKYVNRLVAEIKMNLLKGESK